MTLGDYFALLGVLLIFSASLSGDLERIGKELKRIADALEALRTDYSRRR